MNRTALLLLGATGIVAVLAPVAYRPAPRLVWNVSASAPLGGYAVQPGSAPAIGDYAVIRPPEPFAEWMVDRDYVGRDVPLIKRIVAVHPSSVCRFADRVIVDGVATAVARDHDRFGRSLPVWSGCRTLARGEVFALNAPADSFDGRYFGVTPADSIIGRATPLRRAEAH